MSQVITSAGQLLKEVSALRSVYSVSETLYPYIEKYFSLEDRVPWQIGVLRFNKLIDRTLLDLEIIPEARQGKYRKTLDKDVRALVMPGSFSHNASDIYKRNITDLTIERLENFNDALLLAGRSFSIEDARVTVVTEAISDLIEEMNADELEIDEAILPHLKNLLMALERYSLFGSDGVEDYVSQLIGATFIKGMELAGPVSPKTKKRINKVLSIAKGSMDGFVYLAAGTQSIEWASAHLARLTSGA